MLVALKSCLVDMSKRHIKLHGGLINHQTALKECIINAINRGHDSDTTGAVAGMIAGAMHGFNAIP